MARIFIRDHRIEFDIVQQPASLHDVTPAPDRHIVLFPTRYAPRVPAELPAQSAGRPSRRRKARAKTHAIRQVAVLEVPSRLSDVVVEDLDLAIQLALAEAPRGVVCDLSAVREGAEPRAVRVLATAGRHARDWPGIPVAVACPNARVREGLHTHSLGEHLIVTESIFTAVSTVLSTPTQDVERLRLAPHPTAPRAARNFITRTLRSWRLDAVTPFASLVISELVASSSINAGTDIDLSVVWDRSALRVTVRDHGPALPGQYSSVLGLHGRGLTVVAGLSRAFGVMPCADGGKVVWAVLETHKSRQSAKRETLNLERESVTPLDPAPPTPEG